MKDERDTAKALCRWFTPDGEPTSQEDYDHCLKVLRAIQADALRHAAGICWAGGRTEDIENAEAIEAEARKLEGK